jgi:hypothetical protein
MKRLIPSPPGDARAEGMGGRKVIYNKEIEH